MSAHVWCMHVPMSLWRSYWGVLCCAIGMVGLFIDLIHTNLRLLSRLASCLVLMSALAFGHPVRHLSYTALPMSVARLGKRSMLCFALCSKQTQRKERLANHFRAFTHTHTALPLPCSGSCSPSVNRLVSMSPLRRACALRMHAVR